MALVSAPGAIRGIVFFIHIPQDMERSRSPHRPLPLRCQPEISQFRPSVRGEPGCSIMGRHRGALRRRR